MSCLIQAYCSYSLDIWASFWRMACFWYELQLKGLFDRICWETFKMFPGKEQWSSIYHYLKWSITHFSWWIHSAFWEQIYVQIFPVVIHLNSKIPCNYSSILLADADLMVFQHGPCIAINALNLYVIQCLLNNSVGGLLPLLFLSSPCSMIAWVLDFAVNTVFFYTKGDLKVYMRTYIVILKICIAITRAIKTL